MKRGMEGLESLIAHQNFLKREFALYHGLYGQTPRRGLSPFADDPFYKHLERVWNDRDMNPTKREEFKKTFGVWP